MAAAADASEAELHECAQNVLEAAAAFLEQRLLPQLAGAQPAEGGAAPAAAAGAGGAMGAGRVTLPGGRHRMGVRVGICGGAAAADAALEVTASHDHVGSAAARPLWLSRAACAAPPSILVVLPCALALSAHADADPRDVRRRTARLSLTLAVHAAPGAPPPDVQLFARHAGRCLPLRQRLGRQRREGGGGGGPWIQEYAVELGVAGVQPGLLLLEAAAREGEAPGARAEGEAMHGGAPYSLSLPWPVVLLGDATCVGRGGALCAWAGSAKWAQGV